MDDVPEIMVTIGPTLETPDDVLRAIEAGARWFRLPCGYRQRPHLQNAQTIRRGRREERHGREIAPRSAVLASADGQHGRLVAGVRRPSQVL